MNCTTSLMVQCNNGFRCVCRISLASMSKIFSTTWRRLFRIFVVLQCSHMLKPGKNRFGKYLQCIGWWDNKPYSLAYLLFCISYSDNRTKQNEKKRITIFERACTLLTTLRVERNARLTSKKKSFNFSPRETTCRLRPYIETTARVPDCPCWWKRNINII